MFKNKLWMICTVVALGVAGCPGGGTKTDGGPTADGGCGGQLGCDCSASACSVGECLANVCTDCKRGDLACICRSNDTCNTGLKCATGVCAACPEGTDSCACSAGDVCGTGLKCTAGTCAPDSCVAGSAACPCRGADPKCDGTLYCDSMSLCQACTADIAGCPCGAGSVCGGGLICDSTSTRCRAPTTCVGLRAGGLCKAHQTCTETATADAVCVPTACDAQYKWDPVTLDCLACQSVDCLDEPACTVADGGGITPACTALNRACVQAGVTAYCGACSPGFAEAAGDGGSATACVPVPLCGATTCTLSQYCDTSSTAPTCQPLPCPAGQAKETFLDGGVGACMACTKSCLGAGVSGRIWPFRTSSGVCICETLTGFFLPPGMSGQPTVCDADSDGWVREEADDSVVRAEPALRANSRCTIRAVDRVRLEDEYKMAAEVRSCTSGMLLNPPSNACTGTVPMRLLETQRNDIPGRADGTNKAPAFGANGRLLEANEINSVTKACVETIGDYNDNQVSDIAEIQGTVVGPDDRARLESFAFFIELYSSFYEPPALGTGPGTLVIRERSRCPVTLADFPLRYDFLVTDPATLTDGYAAAKPNTYWRSCARRRDQGFSTSTPVPGMDFAQWMCAGVPEGSCPGLAPAHPTLISPTNPKTTLLRNHGLCELGGAKPADMTWRGMTHHSQFKCVSVTATVATAYDRNPVQFAVSNTNPGPGPGLTGLVFNRCNAKVCTTPGNPNCTQPQGAGLQTKLPVIQCLAKVPNPGEVGFAAQPYRPYGRASEGYTSFAYSNGCVAEDAETAAVAPIDPAYVTYTCPYPEYSIIKADSDSAFGRYSCYGKLANFLWSPNPPLAVPDRATLKWGTGPADTLNGYLR